MDLEILNNFARAWRQVEADVHSTAVEKGWWQGGARNDGEAIALMHSELSEALEYLRAGNPPDDKIAATGVEAELADVIIRIMDYAAGRGMDVVGALLQKIEYNKTRPAKHGKRF